jgi:hypothetical protein
MLKWAEHPEICRAIGDSNGAFNPIHITRYTDDEIRQ